ncbi:MAG TPA: 6-phosphogluconolactonase [Jatrophihabitans sp.]
MRVTPTVFSAPEEIGRSLAALIADRLTAKSPGRPFLLGCPSGRSPHSTYRALVGEVRRRDLDLRNLIIVMMDEYVDADGGSVDPHAPHSCARFGREEIVAPLSAAARPGHGIGENHFWVPDPRHPARYDIGIAKLGGIDLFILASGASDGHIAFNQPGTARDARTHVVTLSESTRRDNLHTFPTFEDDLDRVPRRGVTVGIGTIRELSKEVVMVVHGAHKTTAVQRLCAAERYEPDWPATILAECTRPELFVDESAIDDSIRHHYETSPAVARTT